MIEKLEKQFTKYEVARILGARALQLAMDAPILMKLSKGDLENFNYDVLKIAELELTEGVLPITVKRPFPEKKGGKIKKIDKEEVEKIKEEKTKREETKEDKKIEEKEQEEVEKIKEEAEIMELAIPEDEQELGESEEVSEELM